MLSNRAKQTSFSFALDSSQADLKDFLALLKPGVMSLVVFTGFIGMVLAPGAVHPFLMVVNLLALALGSGGAAAFNMWYDRDIDQHMYRTNKRPIPSGRIAPGDALSFAIIISAASVLLIGLASSWAAAMLLAFCNFFYSYIYTVLLKRTTSQNIVIGGLAGALPPLIGWMTVSLHDFFLPLWMVGVIFIWTPSHFWALAVIRVEDYRAVGVPMLPVTRGLAKTRLSIYLYSIALVILSLMPVCIGILGWVYGVSATLLGAGYVYFAHYVWSQKTNVWAGRLFGYSIVYLFALFTALFLDQW